MKPITLNPKRHNASYYSQDLSKRCSTAYCNAILLVLLATFALFVPRLGSSAEALTAIAAGAKLTASVISLFDSGANPIATATLQNREMLKSIHLRLDLYDKSFQTIFSKLDDLPDENQKRFLQALDIDQIREVRSAITNIVSDVNVFKDLRANDPTTTATPFSDLSSRMATLQQKAVTLLNHNSDVIFFDALTALYVEIAMISIQSGYTQEEIAILIRNRKFLYHNRFQHMLTPWAEMTKLNGKLRHESLLASLKDAESSLSENVEILNQTIAHDKDPFSAYYSSSDNCGLWECCGICTVRYAILPDKVKRTKAEYDQSLEKISYLEIMISLYRNMAQTIRLELNSDDGEPEFENPPDLVGHYSKIKSRLKLFGKLKPSHSHEGTCPHC